LQNNEMVTNGEIITKAEELNLELNHEIWKASKGWLNKFKNRYSLTTAKIAREQDEEDENSVEDSSVYEVEEDITTTNISDATIIEEVKIEMTPLEAADYLINYVSDNGSFSLKEIITLQMIRDRIAKIETLAE
jgi:hypothetical protein